MNAPERLDYLIKTLEGNNAAMFARKCGIAPASLSRARNGKAKPEIYFQRILSAYPDVRPEWLIRGEGPMLASAERESATEKKLDAIIAKVDGLISMLNEILGQTKAGE